MHLRTLGRVLLTVSVVALALGVALAGVEWRRRPPPPQPVPPPSDLSEPFLTVLFFGDAGSGTPLQARVGAAMARVCESLDCDLGLILGDVIYAPHPLLDPADPVFARHFSLPYAGLARLPHRAGRPALRLWAVAGNHDLEAGIEALRGFARRDALLEMPAGGYAVPGLPDWLHVYGLNTPPIHDRAPDATALADGDWHAQIDAARTALCDPATRGWKILFGHHPIHSTTHGVSETMRDRLGPLIAECGVQLYLAGHAHQQEHIRALGFDQLIQGAAGAPRPVRGWFRLAPRPEFRSEVAGFGVLRVSRSELWVRFHDADGRAIYSFSRIAPEHRSGPGISPSP